MLNILLSPSTWIGAAVGAGLTLGWAVFIHGPAQYEAGGVATAKRLDDATNKAIGELTNEADRREFLLERCRLSGRVYDFVSGECVEG